MRHREVRIALPKGRLLPGTSSLLTRGGLDLAGYNESTRLYTFRSARFPEIVARMFQEKDIPVQVAVGNYDLGICGRDWVEELLVRYPDSRLVRVAELGYGRSSVYAAVHASASESVVTSVIGCRVVSEYPNLAEAYAIRRRLRGFKIFPVWGATEVYPPESADLVVLSGMDEDDLQARGLTPVSCLLRSEACLIVNTDAWETRDLSPVLNCLRRGLPVHDYVNEKQVSTVVLKSEPRWRESSVWLALPDGHQKPPTVEFLERAGIRLEGYSLSSDERRPGGEWVDAKVIRPQDMPQQVANGNFDLAITGRDWLMDHLTRFPSSPVVELLDLGFGWVRIVAAMSRQHPVSSLSDLKVLMSRGVFRPLRVCSEYVNIADRYLWENHLSPYRIIPTWGASEAFLPDDADLLIENTQTGKTLERQGLGIIDVLFESTACVIGNKKPPESAVKRERIEALLEAFRRAVGKSS